MGASSEEAKKFISRVTHG